MSGLLLSILFLLPSLLHSQQPYAGLSITDCSNPHNSTSLQGYFCNAPATPFCPSFLTFTSQPPHDSVSDLLSSDPPLLAPATAAKLIIPVNCSCTANYYQFNARYTVRGGDTPFIIANNTFQGLTTCQAVDAQNKPSFSSLLAGAKINVPLRCACPTAKQRSNGTKYLLTYLVDPGDTIFLIGTKFGVTDQAIFDANQITDSLIYPYTTLLIPLQSVPDASQLADPPISPPPPSSPASGKSSGESHTGVYAGIGVGTGVIVLIIASVVLYCVFFKKKGNGKIKGKQAVQPDHQSLEAKVFGDLSNKEIVSRISEISHTLRVYKIKELQLATENFSHECKIKGSVYRGNFNGDVAAVKMMSKDVSNEINLLKRISHANLISLSGVCFDQGRWYLVYEYAKNGSLNNWLFDKSGAMVLSWVQRVQIALDIANGLNYLHEYTEPSYVHKDVNSSNVLLDEKFRAKISNFGNARPAQEKEGELVLTRHIVGTIGYMSPEYLEHGFVSPMLDVYAFGAVMMEIMTGSSVVDHGSKMESFIASLGEEDVRDKLEGFMDSSLGDNYPADLALVIAGLIGGCLKENASSRPSMAEISQCLSMAFAASQRWEVSQYSLSEPTSFGSESELLA